MRKTLLMLLVFCIALEAKTLTDQFGRTVELPDRVDRVLALSGTLRVLVHLGSIDKIVATERIEQRDQASRGYTYAHRDRLSALPVVGEGGARPVWNIEAILAAKPDVIFAAFLGRAGAEQLQKQTGVPVVMLAYSKGNETGVDLAVLGKAFQLAAEAIDRPQKAQEINTLIAALQADLKKRGGQGDSAYIGGVAYKGMQGINSTESGFLPFELAGVKNVADADKRGHRFIDREQVLIYRPDRLFIDAGGWPIIHDDAVKNRGFYALIEPLKKGEAYTLLPTVFYGTNIDTVFINAYAVGKTVNPEGFKDINLRQKADEIYRAFNHGESVLGPMLQNYDAFKRVKLGANGLELSPL